MTGLIKHVLHSAGLGFFPSAALVLFVMVFVSVLLREMLRSKQDVRELECLPLDDGQASEQGTAHGVRQGAVQAAVENGR